MPGGSRHVLRAPAGPELLEPVAGLLAQLWADEPEVPVDRRVRFETAVAEVAANIAEHGAAAGAREVSLTLTCSATSVQAVFEDDGAAPRLPSDGTRPPSDEAERGRGLLLARAAVDSLMTERAAGRNRWVLRLGI